MKTEGWRGWLVVGFSLSVAFGAAPAEGSAPPRSTCKETMEALTITVRAFNYTQIAHETLVKAGAEASRVLRRAGINVVWLNCHSSKQRVQRLSACERAPGPAEITLRILYRPTAPPSSFQSTMGLCIVPEPGRFGNIASVFPERVKELAAIAGVPQAVVLGHAVAHEIGHLLLGTHRHSPQGIMRARWCVEDLRLAVQGYLRFTRQERQLLRAAVRERLGPQEATERAVVLSNHQFEFQK